MPHSTSPLKLVYVNSNLSSGKFSTRNNNVNPNSQPCNPRGTVSETQCKELAEMLMRLSVSRPEAVDAIRDLLVRYKNIDRHQAVLDKARKRFFADDPPAMP